jgi:hypothetical protein
VLLPLPLHLAACNEEGNGEGDKSNGDCDKESDGGKSDDDSFDGDSNKDGMGKGGKRGGDGNEEEGNGKGGKGNGMSASHKQILVPPAPNLKKVCWGNTLFPSHQLSTGADSLQIFPTAE